MTVLVWDQPASRRHESGISHGVFYPSVGSGVVWNGLQSVVEGFVGGEYSFYHLDGVKYLDTVAGKDFQLTVTAFSSPKEFLDYSGYRSLVPGVRLTKQPKPRFNFSYQSGIDDGYKIHLVYNVLATLTDKTTSTIGRAIDPSTSTWMFDAVPVSVPGFKPSAHYTIDSTKADPDILALLENILYGTESTNAYFPDINDLVTLFGGV